MEYKVGFVEVAATRFLQKDNANIEQTIDCHPTLLRNRNDDTKANFVVYENFYNKTFLC